MKSECCGCARNVAVCCASDCRQSVFQVKRKYKARHFGLKGIGTRRGHGAHEREKLVPKEICINGHEPMTIMWHTTGIPLKNYILSFLVCFDPHFRSSSISNIFWKSWSLIGRVSHFRGPTFGLLTEHFRPFKVLLGTEFSFNQPARKNIE